MELQSTRENYELAVKETDALKNALELQRRAEAGDLEADAKLVYDERLVKSEKEVDQLRQKNQELVKELDTLKLKVTHLGFEKIKLEEQI